MRIINKRTCPCFFPYAGTQRHGANLEVNGISPELPLDRINNAQLKRDLATGVIALVLSKDDKERLSGNLPAEVLKAALSPDEVGVVAASAPASAPAPAPPSAPPVDDPTMVITKGGGDVDKIDAVVEEHLVRLNMLTPEARAEELLKLDPEIAAKVVAALGPQDEVPAPLEAVEEEDVEEDEPVEDYKTWKTTQTVEELNDRGIDFDPSAKLSVLKNLLLDDDLEKAASK